ncbi:MAG: ABC transporter permease [Armatimonadetes bacterium]|nr:ABC transporter permease [Armatimonadota bacterium]
MIIWSIAKTTIGDALRKKVIQIFLVIAIGLIIISLSFAQTLSFSTSEGASTDIMLVKTMGLGLMAAAGWLISLVMGVSLIPQEIERRTIYTILSKPVKRYEFIIGKFVGALLTLGICVALMGLVFIGVVVAKAWGAQASMVSAGAQAAGGLDAHATAQNVQIFDVNMVWGVILIYLQFLVLSSIVLFLSVFLTPTVNFFMGLGVYLVGVMAPITETLANAKGLFVKAFYTAVHYIVPNFDMFNKPNALLHPDAHITSMAAYTGQCVLYGLLYVFVMMTLAVILFEKKEV